MLIKVKPAIPPNARHVPETRATAVWMATSRPVVPVTRVRTLAARPVLTETVVTRVRLGTGDQRVTTHVVQYVKVMSVT